MRQIFILTLVCSFLIRCQSTPQVEQKTSAAFFDLKNFFEQEKKQLKKVNRFVKTVSINEQQEVKELENLNFEDEFSIFIASDINRPAWFDKYGIDSIFDTTNNLERLTYTALDSSLQTKNIAVHFSNKEVASIAIHKSTDNAIAQSSQDLLYIVNEGYSIKTQQTLSLSESKTIIVEVDYTLD